jgi:hypothetical protein
MKIIKNENNEYHRIGTIKEGAIEIVLYLQQ